MPSTPATEHERIDSGARIFYDGYARLESRRLPVSLSLFHAPRLQTRLTATLVEQSGEFGGAVSTPGEVPVRDRDTFTLVDFSISYGLGGRRGKVSLEARNLFDKRFNYQDVDPENTRYFPERALSLRFTLTN